MGSNDSGMFPFLPEELERILENSTESADSAGLYEFLIESQCGVTDDSQPAEQYDGTLGVTTAFVDAHERPVGQLQWNDDLGTIYDNPGNVSGVRWCTGTLISENLFLTAGHCFDQSGGDWQRPLINGTNGAIPPAEIAANMHVNFNYQVDPDGDLRQVQEFTIEELVEYRLGNLDFAIVRLSGSPGQTFGTGTVAQEDATENDIPCIIGHPAGVPKRIEAGPLTFFDGDRIRYNDIDTLGGNSGSAILHSPGGKIVGIHTNGGCTNAGTGSNFGVRISRLLEESPTLRSLFSPSPALQGVYTIQQKSNDRFADAYESEGNDFSAVTRSMQDNDTQKWVLTPVGAVYTIQQKSSDRFADAHESEGNDFSAVTRTVQNNDTQKWVFMHVDNNLCTYTIQQLSSGRFLDAHESGNDLSVVTRTAQNNDTQRWILKHLSNNMYTIQQKVNGRFLDAHESGNDFSIVTRAAHNNDTQRWILRPVGVVYTIQQLSSGRFLDAHESGNDFSVVTRAAYNNDTQRWVLMYSDGDAYTIQQLSNGRFLDAYESGNDFSIVTRTAGNNDTQRWVIKSL